MNKLLYKFDRWIDDHTHVCTITFTVLVALALLWIWFGQVLGVRI